jgi:hypothetical protein
MTSGIFPASVSDDGTTLHLNRPQFRAFLKRFAGQCVELELRLFQAKRSLRQNRGFHAMLQPWVREGYPIDELKRDLLMAVFGTAEMVSPVTGEVRLVPCEPHTSTLSVRQFSELIERTLEIAAECGVILQAPDEYTRQHAALARKAAQQAQKGPPA